MAAVDIAIHGRGAVACSLALALNQQGLRVALSAPAAGGGADVRAYALNLASRRLLQSLKIWNVLPGDAVTPVHEMDVRGDRAGTHLGFSSWTQCVDALAWIVDVPALEGALEQALQFAPLVQRHDVLPPAALRVYAEGRDSSSRATLPVQWQRHAYGHTAIAARLTSADGHGNVAHQWFRAPDVLALLPLDQPVAGRSFALVWSLPQAEAERLMRLDVAAFDGELQRACADGPRDLQLASERAAWPLALASASPVCGEGWVLIGDAAHVVHPLAGQGLNLGLADVQALADTLRQRESWRTPGDRRVLHRYARARAWPVWAMSRLTDALVHGFASDGRWQRELRNRGMGLVDRTPAIKRWLAAQALEG